MDTELIREFLSHHRSKQRRILCKESKASFLSRVTKKPRSNYWARILMTCHLLFLIPEILLVLYKSYLWQSHSKNPYLIGNFWYGLYIFCVKCNVYAIFKFISHCLPFSDFKSFLKLHFIFRSFSGFGWMCMLTEFLKQSLLSALNLFKFRLIYWKKLRKTSCITNFSFSIVFKTMTFRI